MLVGYFPFPGLPLPRYPLLSNFSLASKSSAIKDLSLAVAKFNGKLFNRVLCVCCFVPRVGNVIGAAGSVGRNGGREKRGVGACLRGIRMKLTHCVRRGWLADPWEIRYTSLGNTAQANVCLLFDTTYPHYAKPKRITEI